MGILWGWWPWSPRAAHLRTICWWEYQQDKADSWEIATLCQDYRYLLEQEVFFYSMRCLMLLLEFLLWTIYTFHFKWLFTQIIQFCIHSDLFFFFVKQSYIGHSFQYIGMITIFKFLGERCLWTATVQRICTYILESWFDLIVQSVYLFFISYF